MAKKTTTKKARPVEKMVEDTNKFKCGGKMKKKKK